MPRFEVTYTYREGTGLDYCFSTNGGRAIVIAETPSAARLAAIDYAYETHTEISHVYVQSVREIGE